MSEPHTHGVHEHIIEEQAHKGISLAQYVAIFTAILSVFIALISHKSHHSENQAFLLKNEALRLTNHSASQWAYYQAKTSKGNLALLASELTSGERAKYYKVEAERYLSEATHIKTQAEYFDEHARQADKTGNAIFKIHHNFAQILILLHIAIALGAVTVLTHKRWLFFVALAIAIIACLMAGRLILLA